MYYREIGKEEDDDDIDFADDDDDDDNSDSNAEATTVTINTKPSMSDQKIIGEFQLFLELCKSKGPAYTVSH